MPRGTPYPTAAQVIAAHQLHERLKQEGTPIIAWAIHLYLFCVGLVLFCDLAGGCVIQIFITN